MMDGVGMLPCTLRLLVLIKWGLQRTERRAVLFQHPTGSCKLLMSEQRGSWNWHNHVIDLHVKCAQHTTLLIESNPLYSQSDKCTASDT